MLPFTHAQFISVFARYNANVWPAQLVAYGLALAMVLAILRPSVRGDRFVAGALAAMWLWTGIAYHAVHFSTINKAALLFGALFLVQSVLLLRAGQAGRLRFAFSGSAGAWLGAALIVYASVGYPLVGLWAGLRYPELPMFGITPCPLTLFTFGLLLVSRPPVPLSLAAIPVIWSLIGGSAALLLQVPQDWPLLLAGLCVVPIVLQNRLRSPPSLPA
jgi:hypothetical protein